MKQQYKLSSSFFSIWFGITLLGFHFLLIGFSGCKNKAETPAQTESPPLVSPTDCNRASGYFWSELQGDCIELFRIARKLKAASDKVNKHGSVLVVFNADSSRVEMYMPFTRQETIIMDKIDSSIPDRWANEQYTLINSPAMQLMEGEELLYQEQVK
jgi:hypothetical protein